MYVENFIVCIGGFTQGINRVHGIARLWLGLRRFSSPKTQVDLKPYWSNWDKYAEHIFTTGGSQPKNIIIAAYSWGAGKGAQRLANELSKRGVSVTCMILSDPVYYPYIFKFLALTKFGKITLPISVKEVFSFYQTINRPCGRQVVGAENVHPSVELKMTHQYMDDAHEFHECVISNCSKILEEC